MDIIFLIAIVFGFVAMLAGEERSWFVRLFLGFGVFLLFLTIATFVIEGNFPTVHIPSFEKIMVMPNEIKNDTDTAIPFNGIKVTSGEEVLSNCQDGDVYYVCRPDLEEFVKNHQICLESIMLLKEQENNYSLQIKNLNEEVVKEKEYFDDYNKLLLKEKEYENSKALVMFSFFGIGVAIVIFTINYFANRNYKNKLIEKEKKVSKDIDRLNKLRQEIVKGDEKW